ncbi:hypothetical protein J2810_002517 [Chryseobacterium rhizosphaerae]|uniref:hypothetical protein n=1 Tax=Chryseobacterium rhizosphaerae TaxID=395937 RepID=UPI002865A1DD|nr:hypothetical protein [Chryseobacterium rhizosphaerae]MDR6546458.1 hypothetical protein [Chryseobacterium rhizosphaerae]
MKPLHEMNATERAFTLAQMFPQHLEELVNFIKKEIEHLREKEQGIRLVWQSTQITADHWYNVIDDVEEVIRKFNVTLYRSPRIFSDQLFYGHHAMFMIHCLIRYYAYSPRQQLSVAIQLLFGDEKVVTMQFSTEQI